jgi:hypothetical protein
MNKLNKLNQNGGNVALNIILWIFAIVGIIGIIYLVIVYITTSYSNSTSSSSSSVLTYPPNSYMQNGGLDCPDYWIKISQDNKQIKCKNSYGIPLKKDTCNNTAKFSIIDSTTWANTEDKTKVVGVNERCTWLNECGGVWQGIQTYC